MFYLSQWIAFETHGCNHIKNLIELYKILCVHKLQQHNKDISLIINIFYFVKQGPVHARREWSCGGCSEKVEPEQLGGEHAHNRGSDRPQ